MRLWIVLCVPTFRNMFSFFCNVRKCYFLSEKKKTLLIKEGKKSGLGKGIYLARNSLFPLQLYVVQKAD